MVRLDINGASVCMCVLSGLATNEHRSALQRSVDCNLGFGRQQSMGDAFPDFLVLDCAPKRICATVINSLLAQALVSEVEKAKAEKAGCTVS